MSPVNKKHEQTFLPDGLQIGDKSILHLQAINDNEIEYKCWKIPGTVTVILRESIMTLAGNKARAKEKFYSP